MSLIPFFLSFLIHVVFFFPNLLVIVNVYLCNKNQLLNAFKPCVCVLRWDNLFPLSGPLSSLTYFRHVMLP